MGAFELANCGHWLHFLQALQQVDRKLLSGTFLYFIENMLIYQRFYFSEWTV